MSEERKNVYERIAEVMKDVKFLAKDKHVEYGSTKYNAVSEEKVTSSVRKSLIKHGLVIVPIEQNHRREGNLSTVDTKYRIQCIDDKEDYIIAVSSGTGSDTQDKGVGKAMTYAYKYLLLRAFAIPAGEDPDNTPSDKLDEKEKLVEEKKTKEFFEHVEKVEKLREALKKSGTDEEDICKKYKVEELIDLKDNIINYALDKMGVS